MPACSLLRAAATLLPPLLLPRAELRQGGRKLLQTWGQQWTSDAIGRAVDSGADPWMTRQAASVSATNYYGGWGGGRNWVGSGGWWRRL